MLLISNCHQGQLAEPWSHCHTIQREPLHAYLEKTTYAGVDKRGQIFCLGHRSRAAARKVGPDAGKPMTSQGQSFPRRVSLSPLRRKTKNKMSRVASCLLLACWHIYPKNQVKSAVRGCKHGDFTRQSLCPPRYGVNSKEAGPFLLSVLVWVDATILWHDPRGLSLTHIVFKRFRRS